MSTLIDGVVGTLEYDYGWCRATVVEFLGENCAVKIVFAGDEDRPLDDGQRDAFVEFWSSNKKLMLEAEASILRHYQMIRSDVLARLSEGDATRIAPLAIRASDLRGIVRLETIFFPEDFGGGKRVAGLLADCSWDPGLGLAVRFEDERVVDVGPQDIVL